MLKRDKEEKKTVKDLLKKLNDEDDTKFREEVEEVVWLGPYLEGKNKTHESKTKIITSTRWDTRKNIQTQRTRRLQRYIHQEEHKWRTEKI